MIPDPMLVTAGIGSGFYAMMDRICAVCAIVGPLYGAENRWQHLHR